MKRLSIDQSQVKKAFQGAFALRADNADMGGRRDPQFPQRVMRQIRLLTAEPPVPTWRSWAVKAGWAFAPILCGLMLVFSVLRVQSHQVLVDDLALLCLEDPIIFNAANVLTE